MGRGAGKRGRETQVWVMSRGNKSAGKELIGWEEHRDQGRIQGKSNKQKPRKHVNHKNKRTMA